MAFEYRQTTELSKCFQRHELRAPRAELWTREAAGDEWTVIDVIGLDAQLHLPSVNVDIPLDAVYAGLTFPTDPAPS